MLDTQGYKHTLRIGNTYCISTATIVARMRLNVNVIRTLPFLSRFLAVVYIIVVDFDRYVLLWPLLSHSPCLQLGTSNSL
jgi:hypothetical protein